MRGPKEHRELERVTIAASKQEGEAGAGGREVGGEGANGIGSLMPRCRDWGPVSDTGCSHCPKQWPGYLFFFFFFLAKLQSQREL